MSSYYSSRALLIIRERAFSEVNLLRVGVANPDGGNTGVHSAGLCRISSIIIVICIDLLPVASVGPVGERHAHLESQWCVVKHP